LGNYVEEKKGAGQWCVLIKFPCLYYYDEAIKKVSASIEGTRYTTTTTNNTKKIIIIEEEIIIIKENGSWVNSGKKLFMFKCRSTPPQHTHKKKCWRR
jgi:hypothetical protein